MRIADCGLREAEEGKGFSHLGVSDGGKLHNSKFGKRKTEKGKGVKGVRIFNFGFLIFGGVMVVLTLLLSRGNEFSVLGILTWVMSILLVGALLLPDEVLFGKGSVRRWRVALQQPTVWVLLGMMLVGAFFRLYQLDATPPQMTSDHVEKLLDAQRVLNGHWQIFFPNNGGREPLQMYLMAVFSQFPGLGMNFFSLKLLSAVEGIVILPMIWWMTRAIFGETDRQLG